MNARGLFARLAAVGLAAVLTPALALADGSTKPAKEPGATANDPADEMDDTPSRSLVADDAAPPPADPLGPDAQIERWCAPELDALPDEVCSFSPTHEAAGPRTLVIFLHGVVKPDTSWQWAQQRGIARAAETHGFSAIMPRGRIGIGPKGMESWWTWPTASAAQVAVEDELVGEWQAARTELETRTGRPFERVWVFGFSNGAYYAASLATRGRLSDAATGPKAEGFAVFAGGSGAAYIEKAARSTKARAPLFVAWGNQDPAHGDQVKLAKMLRSVGWPSKSEGAKRAGHAMTDKQVADAIRFLSRPSDKASPTDDASTKSPKALSKKKTAATPRPSGGQGEKRASR